MLMYVELTANSNIPKEKKLFLSIDCLIFKTSDNQRFRISDEDSIDSRVQNENGIINVSQRYKGIGVSNADKDHDLKNVEFDNGKGLLSFLKDKETELEELWVHIDDEDETIVISNFKILDMVFVDHDYKNNEELFYFVSQDQKDKFNNTSGRLFIC